MSHHVGRTPTRIALTGGIGTGKSYILDFLASHGVPTVDADDLARAVVAPGGPAHLPLLELFGPKVLDATGAVDRRWLGALVFSDAGARRGLEGVVHPAAWLAVESWFQGLSGQPGVAAIPLLFETGREGGFDAVMVAICSEERQVCRVRARDGLPEEEALRRLATQIGEDERRARGGVVIDTNGTKAETKEQIRQVWCVWGLGTLDT